MRYRATLAYDGTAYQGYQRQLDGVPTIQASVERAVSKVSQQAVHVLAAGRTDTGVHAVGQVIAFDVDWAHGNETLLRAINANLPDDIALQDVRQQEGFHPRFDALARRYCYTVMCSAQRQPLLHRQVWHIKYDLDDVALGAVSALLIGQHDFATFGNPPQGDNTVREVFVSEWKIEPTPYGKLYRFTIEATAFLHHMVRRIVGMQIDVAGGRFDLEEFVQRFGSADLSLATTLAPPQGLVLEKVRYPDDDN
ncbi:MAG: tRNA pseudouridine(38-40) synthase TruA [Aggregatilineales bacterium]